MLFDKFAVPGLYNYAPVQRQLLRDVFGVEPPPIDYPPETWPDYAAPIIVSMKHLPKLRF